MALEDRDCNRKRLHLVVQPELPYKYLISKHIELYRILHRLFTPVLEYIIELIHVLHLVGNSESTALIFSIGIERRSRSLFVVLVLQKQEDARRRSSA